MNILIHFYLLIAYPIIWLSVYNFTDWLQMILSPDEFIQFVNTEDFQIMVNNLFVIRNKYHIACIMWIALISIIAFI